MKRLGYIILLTIILVVGCSQQEISNDQKKEATQEVVAKKTNDEESIEEITLVKENEFIELSNTKVKFLFKTTPGATVELYLKKGQGAFERVKTVENYSYEKGLDVEGFEPGNIYHYKVVSKFKKKKVESKKHSFVKLKIRDTIKKSKWAKKAIFYEIFVRSFYDASGDGVGDFEGIIKKLDYLEELGVTALWLMPTTDSPSYHGYDTIDYYTVNEDYGSMNHFQKLLEEAHKRDIKVIMDFVVNHSSSEHPWFKKALAGDPKYRDYYVWADAFDPLAETGEWGQRIWHRKTGSDYYMGIFWSEMPDLNLRNDDVRKEMKQIAQHWLELGVDGFRLDASKHIDDKNAAVTHAWWKEFSSYVKEVKPDAFIVGENWDENINVIAPYFNDMDSSFNFALSELIISTVNNRAHQNILEEQLEMHETYEKVAGDFIDATFIRNHDMSRTRSALFGSLEKAKLAASIHLTLPGTPFIYYGEELGQKGKKPDDNIREPFDWYQETNGPGMTDMSKSEFYNPMRYTEANDGISYEEQKNDKNSIFNHYKKLIQLRKEYPKFFQSNYKVLDIGENILAYEVLSEEETLLIIHNTYTKDQTVDLREIRTKNTKELLHGLQIADKITLSPYQSIILRK